ncbi:hypothetical protein FGSG_02949 [Fusarium graminearum PH-1]|uniref:Chromosome 2, complete genome n=1 Tax=Gibberella zeae (strain ATCC MYA-4620 / CBS 123657 / FGSC 9075 / NRRL 31084 / PH-1) TaxID=229533 RepID=I1RGS4_GIBZE|nr:hypothetical protein FGSG_02949 [Fusarium graminearum PH-1]ESU10350.1 hypothetical protein FGSG_02949 [Fusarium graminearum PH-1]CEF77647.1 unnamed protein product [Fusarium graminearum]|eukprot:XP_011322849.1 hypothetical protein FGSG_02949 [Fusarium graminearum PH-1]
MEGFFKAKRNHKAFVPICAVFTFTCVSMLLLHWHWYWDTPPSIPTPPSVDRDRRFAMVIPATGASPELCKTVMTGLALGYPSPIIVNWGVDHRPLTHWRGGRNLLKVPGIVDYLEAATRPDAHPSERLDDDDIVLIVDGYDIWFQLPAQVMLERYHRINKEANERLQKEWNQHQKGPMPMRQTIVAATGKRCDPKNENRGTKMQCDIWPESPLRKDLYGPHTDEDKTCWEFVDPLDTERVGRRHCGAIRPRWLNGGLYMGPAGDLRRLFRRCFFTLQTGIGRGIKMRSEQSLAYEAVVEQETFRQWQRLNGRPKPGVSELMNDKLEYHIGLDYAEELSVQTQWAQDKKGLDHGAFITLGDQELIDRHSESRGISPTRLRGLPDDIKSAPNPLSALQPRANWTNMPLYADFFTETVSAIVHHNGVGILKTHRSTWWDRPWYFQHLRQLLHIRLRAKGEAEEPLATVQTPNGRVRYWATSAENTSKYPRRMRNSLKHGLGKMKFGEMCRKKSKVGEEPPLEWYDEIFRDNRGSWGG